jgi:hypothetical protein
MQQEYIRVLRNPESIAQSQEIVMYDALTHSKLHEEPAS